MICRRVETYYNPKGHLYILLTLKNDRDLSGSKLDFKFFEDKVDASLFCNSPSAQTHISYTTKQV